MSRGEKVTVKCKCCRQPFEARVADRRRGWGKFCSKSCKAKRQEARTGQHAAHVSAETFQHYQREYGGQPVFNRRGEYEGFLSGPFDNTAHQNSGENE